MVEQHIKRIAYAIGFDITEPDALDFLMSLVNAGWLTLRDAGVRSEILYDWSDMLPALIHFVTDNLNMEPGEFKRSPMFILEVERLRLK